MAYGVPAFLVETLLDRGTEGDVAEARERDRPLGEPAGRRRFGAARHLAAAAARAAGPGPRRRNRPTATWRSRYRAMAESLGFEGHIAMAEAMM